jgi:exonuclease 3'-5' domain-containing protein 1
VVDTKEKVAEMVNNLTALPIDEPNIGVDLEGKNLGRDGPLYILIIHDHQAEHTYIVDVHTLQLDAFNACGADEEKNLRWILESPETSKLIYDVRQDSEALYHQFGIRLDGILDVQLFKLADMSDSFESPALYRTGLYKAISHSIVMNWEVQNKWLHIKEVGEQLWDPDQGGSWDRFTEKNKCRAIIEYCLVDVVHLRTLYRRYSKGLSERWLARIKATTKQSIEETWADDYESSGAEGPWEQQ